MERTAQDAFDAFVAASGGRLLRLAYGLTGDRGLAEDLLQEALAKTYLRWQRIREPGAAEAYVRRVLVTTHISQWRRRRVVEHVGAALPDVAGADAYAGVDQRDEVWAALAGLGRKQRAVLVLRYFEDRDDADIARLLGCSTATVRSQAARAIAHLRLVPGLGITQRDDGVSTTAPERWQQP
ncbi:MAG TPA: SigE family RNA polymerase sigma factor [Mycobacteriales bacterium]|nr:SigE family RNA polymerase sigma factor [Mycobacteriales bacterium]